jgi:ketosteroid isomerase-like protein
VFEHVSLRRACASAAAALLGAGALAGPAPAAAGPGGEIATLEAVNAAVNAANKARDAEASVAQDAEDMVSYFPGVPPVRGRAADLVAARALFADPAYAYVQTLERTEIARSGDLAWQSGGYEITLTDPATHQPRRSSGHWLAALRKDADGAWRYVVFAGTPSPP